MQVKSPLNFQEKKYQAAIVIIQAPILVAVLRKKSVCLISQPFFMYGGRWMTDGRTQIAAAFYSCKDQNGFDEWTEIPEGFARGCAIAVKSKQEIWLIGGRRTEERILSFNVESQTFQVMPFQLNVGTQMCFHSKHQQNHDNRWS